eukprot:GHUV01030826.1.p1 GENE.GHUV01030826.1~~GHUV01030826.1.p1  ORF type:complete len:522 (+),score=79.04 GHUV01030826.1:303-1868(+)
MLSTTPDWHTCTPILPQVAYNVCSILTPENGEAYGIIWEPKDTAGTESLTLSPGPRAGCYWYKARAGDYMSRVAWLAGIRLDKFMIDNAPYVKDLDAPLVGTNLLVCKPGKPEDVHPSGDTQLDALMRIKSAVDRGSYLKQWTETLALQGDYCNWESITCNNDNMVTELILTMKTIGVGLQGTLPPASAFTRLTKLTAINVGDQPTITGPLPADWFQLKQLVDIRVVNNSLNGTIPAAWGSLSKMRVLYLWDNKLTGQIPDTFKAFKFLELFDVSANQLTGTIPAWLGSLTSLEKLVIYENHLSGPLPDSLKNLKVVEVFFVNNKLMGTIPAWLGGLTMLKDLTLDENRFTGPLPDIFTKLSSLQRLRVNDNRLNGTIPASLGSLRRLETLYLGSNGFTGQLPTSLRGLKALQHLTVDYNRLAGTIPAWLSELTELRRLYLGENKFTGTLPDSFKMLAALEELDVEANSLVGTIPASWSRLTHMKRVWLRGNIELGGCLPKSWSGKLDSSRYSGTNITGFC